MNTNQFTQKTMEALQRAQQIAVEYQHMQVDEEHMLLSLTEDAKALIPQLLTRCGISVDAFRAALNDALSRIPRVSGARTVLALFPPSSLRLHRPIKAGI